MTDKKPRKRAAPLDRVEYTKLTNQYIAQWEKRIDNYCKRKDITRDDIATNNKQNRALKNSLRPNTKVLNEWAKMTLVLANAVMNKMRVTSQPEDFQEETKSQILYACTRSLYSFQNKPDRCAYSYFFRAGQTACYDVYRKRKQEEEKEAAVKHDLAVSMGVEPKDDADNYNRKY